MENITVNFVVNGQERQISTPPNRTLLHVLREDLGLTGVKNGCEEGECGACTVIVNGNAINSCLMFIGQADHCKITTIEGVSDGDQLHPVQQALLNNGAVQCGFCTPGFVMSIIALLDKNPNPTDEEIRVALSGNLCRCTGYTKIIQAVKSVVKELSNER